MHIGPKFPAPTETRTYVLDVLYVSRRTVVLVVGTCVLTPEMPDNTER